MWKTRNHPVRAERHTSFVGYPTDSLLSRGHGSRKWIPGIFSTTRAKRYLVPLHGMKGPSWVPLHLSPLGVGKSQAGILLRPRTPRVFFFSGNSRQQDDEC